MKKKDQYDQSDVDDLVKKLQATFLSEEKNTKSKKNQKMDEDDRAFRNKLASLLDRLSHPPKRKKDTAPPPELLSEENDEMIAAEATTETIAVDAESTEAVETQVESLTGESIAATEQSPTLKKEKKKTSKPRKRSVARSEETTVNAESEPAEADFAPIEEPVLIDFEEPPIENTASDEPKEVLIEETASDEPDKMPIAESATDGSEEALPKPRHPLNLVLPIDDTEQPALVSPPEPSDKSDALGAILEESAADQGESSDLTDEEENVPEVFETESLVEPIAEEPVAVTVPDAPTSDEEPMAATSVSETVPEAVVLSARKTILEPRVSEKPRKAAQSVPSEQTGNPKWQAPVTVIPPSGRRDAEINSDLAPKKAVPRDPSTPITIKSPAPTREREAVDRTDPDAIVIRPPTSGKVETETIVIRPKQVTKSRPVLQPTEARRDAPPIKIGKEILPVSPSSNTTRDSDKQAPNMKKETPPITPETPPEARTDTVKRPPSVSAIRSAEPTAPSAAPSPEASDTAEPEATAKKKKSAPGVSLPREGMAAKKKAARKKPAVSAPAEERSDDHLEEVLDDDLTAQTYEEEIPVDEPEEPAPPPQKMSLFQRRLKRKEEREEEKLSTLDLICKRSGLTADDVNMIFELGYEGELGRLVGYENLKRLKTEHLRQVKTQSAYHYRTAFGYRGEEWTGNHRDAVLAAYVHDRRHVLLRLVLTVLLSTFLFFVEMPQLIGTPLLSIAASMPLLLPIVGMLIFVCVALLSLGQIEAGIRALFRFEPTPYSVTAILPPLVLIYDLLALFAGSPMPHANFTASLTFLAIAICDMLRLNSEMQTLRIMSSEAPKQMLSAALPRKKKLRSGEKIVKIINDDLGENLYQIKPGMRTVGFFRRSNDLTSAARPFTVLIVLMLSLATAFALVCSVRTSSASAALSTFLSVLLAATPTSAILTYFYPLCRANRLLAKRGCTLVGEESVTELSSEKTVIFPDHKLYTAEKSTQLSIRTGDDFRTDLRLTTSLLRKLGGTAEQITNGSRSTREDPPVSIVRIQDGGIEAMVDHSNHLLLGNEEFMKRGGIRIPRESSDVALSRPESVSMMYVAINGVLKFSYEVEYSPNERLEDMIRDLAESNTTPALHTYDPNLNDAFLRKLRGEEAEPVRVIKPGRFEEERPQELVDAVAVATNDALDAASAIHAAKSIANVRRFGFRMQLIGSLIGASTVLFLAFIGRANTFSMLPIAAYQGFWVLISLISSFGEINRKKLHF